MEVLGIYPQACRFLKLKHHIHSPYEKSIIERTMQYIKDRTESFDDYFPCKKKKCKLKHVINWLNLFSDFHNKELYIKWTEPIDILNQCSNPRLKTYVMLLASTGMRAVEALHMRIKDIDFESNPAKVFVRGEN